MNRSLRLAGAVLLLAALPGSRGDAQAQQAAAPLRSAAAAPRLIAYKSTPTRELYLHVFTPDRAAFPGARPAIVFFHGGGWVEGDAARFHDQARHLAELGMVAISAEYRLGNTDGTDPRTALSDAISAMRHVRAKAQALGIDPARIAAGGGSAGGQLAAALATSTGFEDPADDPALPYRPSALVLFNPVIDNGPDGFGYRMVADYWQAFSPLHNVRPGHPPTLIMLGTRDALVPVATGEAYCARVRAAGAACGLHLYAGQPHAFFNQSRSKLFYRKTTAAMDGFLAALGYISP